MRFGSRLLWLVVICCMLMSCASSRLSQELQAGKQSFESGSYKEAFHQLLPLAVNGKKEAQYAVGYMYYYGYGVAEDSESGIFWMTKAADQCYEPAVKALQIIQHPTADSWSSIPSRQPSSTESRRDVILHQQNMMLAPMQTASYRDAEDYRMQAYVPVEPVATAQVAPPRIQKTVAAETAHTVTPYKTASLSSEKQPVLPSESARKYALQLYGSYHLGAVKDLQMQLRLKNTGHIYHTTHEGKDWYVLTFGNFVTAHEASATQKNLPDELRGMHPWVRNVDELRMV